MKEESISVPITVKAIVEALQAVDFSQLLKFREQLNNLIEQQEGYGEDELVSEVGIDYSYLQSLLATGEWEAADQETIELIAEAIEQDESCIFIEEVDNFPLSDLNTIDRLWVKYSHGRFGFSVQRKIWQAVGFNQERFGELVGWYEQAKWIEKGELNYTYDAPVGHLPFIPSGMGQTTERWSAEYFTDSEGEAQYIQTADTVESIRMWKAFIKLVVDDET